MIILKKFLFVSDLDGTLLNKKHDLSRSTIRNIRKLVKKGHYVVPNTGRPYQGTIKFIDKLQIDCPFICDNGGSIYWHGHNDFPKFYQIDKEIAISFFKEIDEFVYSAMLASHQKIYLKNSSKIPFWMKHRNEETQLIEEDYLNNIDTDITNISIYIFEEDRNKMLEALDKYKDHINYREWGSHLGLRSYELYSVNSSKGNAMLYLKKYLEIEDGCVLGFGDNLNDIELLEKADVPVSMKNSRSELHKYSKYITKHSNKKNGVIKFIKKYLKQRGK